MESKGIVSLVVVSLVVIIFWLKPNTAKSNKNLSKNMFQKPPGKFTNFLTMVIIVTIFAVSMNSLSELIVHGEDGCDSRHKKHHCHEQQMHDEQPDLAIMQLITQDGSRDDYNARMPEIISPSEPYFYLIYSMCCLFLLSCIRLGRKRYQNHAKAISLSNEKHRPILRKFALDPNGVIEGRIKMPDRVSHSVPTRKENRRLLLVYMSSAFFLIITIYYTMNLINFFGDYSFTNRGRDYQTVKISLMALGYTYAGNTTVRYLSSNYFGDEDNNDAESTVSSTQIMNDAQINHSPASANDVLDALRREMRQTRQESELLRAELSQTKTKITKLECELDEKTSELQSIQELSLEMEKIIAETNLSGEKSLSLMDSVMVGDALFNGDKIDRQIFNDPNAIARAAIEAYKEGQKDKELLDFDF